MTEFLSINFFPVPNVNFLVIERIKNLFPDDYFADDKKFDQLFYFDFDVKQNLHVKKLNFIFDALNFINLMNAVNQ